MLLLRKDKYKLSKDPLLRFPGRAVTNLAMYKSLQTRARQECRSPVDRPSGIEVTKLKPEHEVHARDILDLRSTSDRTRALGPHIQGKETIVTVFVDFAGRCHAFEV